MDLRTCVLAGTVGILTLSLATPMTAAPLLPTSPAPAAAFGTSGPHSVAYRHWRGGHDWHPGLGRRHGYQYGYRPHHDSKGPAVRAAITGSAALGSAIANSRAQAGAADIACGQRYRSYDPVSRTYLGKDGRRHACR
ncbi:conserved exported hypothetical protein [Bradyrhizobium sp. ORS 375]|uniref:BA14K family protein n=1 Tax=Bradyrhizobium sp. (strain ORS 375) TaxID=566679 RepID=UPI0002405A01|nr:BA14K family protein [Bradyrhizobium sp. ORS 375]CCD97051.1 conserved exported hypothetical protein [Bradyrhizobium sp. ORS 375]